MVEIELRIGWMIGESGGDDGDDRVKVGCEGKVRGA